MKTKNTPFPGSTSMPVAASGFTLGLDLGDRQYHVCVLAAAGQLVRAAARPNPRPALAQLLGEFPTDGRPRGLADREVWPTARSGGCRVSPELATG